MSTPMFSIGGISSGLDTDGIIRQLMALERVPVVRFEQRQAALRQVDDAWGRITTRLSAVRTAVDALRRPETFAQHVTATSSNPEAVSVTASGTPAPGSTELAVVRLASAHQLAAGGTYTARDARVGEGALTLTRGDGTVLATLPTDEHTTLDQLAQRITEAKVGVAAQVVKTGENAHRLVVTATGSGAGARFGLQSAVAGLDTVEELRRGEDAHLRVGTLDVHRPTNTVNDLVEGVTLQLRQVTGAQCVTVSTRRDADAAVKTVRGLVDALNGALASMKELSSYNAESNRAGPLQGNATLRRLVSDLRAAVSGAVAGLGGVDRHASEVGIGLDRHGAVTLDEARLRAALADGYERVTALFARAGAATDARVVYASATGTTAAGTYAVRIDRAATVASVTGATYLPPTGEPKVFTITTGNGAGVSVSIEEGADLATAVRRISDALAAHGVSTLAATVKDGGLHLAETRHGSAHAFTVAGSGDAGLDGVHAGSDVEGTIGGLAATGRGRTLTGTDGAVIGLSVRVSASQDTVDAAGGAFGEVTFTTGLGGALDRTVRVFEGAGGEIARARQSITNEIRRFGDRIAEFDVRLASRETTLRRQFNALESAMGRLKSQSAWMASHIQSLNAQRG
ncbi:MAG TPA: flagellar filament capping protein FliD [Egibacteraceae bacterium]|nr:flagellar filament capping protein FliD [Egibacteraceae bacterium]